MPRKLYDIRNYPHRSGTSQPQRHNADLLGEKVKIDEHSIADYIVFAHKLSIYLKYYNIKNEEAGNWQNFLQQDITYHTAVATADKSSFWEEAWAELMENIEATGSAADIEKKHRQYFTWRFDFLYSLTGRLVEIFIHSGPLQQWHDELKALYTTSNLHIIYGLLQQYYVVTKTILADDAGIFSHKDLTLQLQKTITTKIETYKAATDEILQHAGIPIQIPELFADADSTVEKIEAASEYLDDLARQLIHLYGKVNTLAEKHLQLSLTSYDQHEPHVGLFYAFLQLLEAHKIEINSLLLKHLDYYYKQVLHVKPKPFQPSKAYITFEPAKNINEHYIKAGSPLAAGKDNTGKDVFYITQQDIIVNKAEPGDIKSFTFIKNSGNIQNERVKIPPGESLGIYACAMANSSDGKTKPLLPGQSWEPYRASSSSVNVDAQIGISFYSALLHEAPVGKRVFGLNFKFANTGIAALAASLINEYGTIKIFTDKEPVTPSISTPVVVNDTVSFSFIVEEKIKISTSSPNTSLLFGKKSTLIVNEFINKIILFQFTPIIDISLSLISQEITVTKAETLMGDTDLSSAFPAFGGVPKKGSSFKVIEPLLKNRTVSALNMKIEWASKTERSFGIKTAYLKTTTSEESTARSIDNNISESILEVINNKVSFISDYIRIYLEQDLGHLTYGQDMARAVNDDNPFLFYMAERIPNVRQEIGEGAKKGAERMFGRYWGEQKGFPAPPYTPMIKSITLTCTLSENILANIASSWLYNQFPHGYKKIEPGTGVFLLPRTEFEGELYIGVKSLKPAQSLNILIQVEDGTADPTLPNPDIKWHYLDSNTWTPFNPSLFKDGTKGLIQSGIVSIVSPDKDCTTNTLLPAGQFWIRAAAHFNETKAVCKIFSIHTQAVLARFEDHDNDPAYRGTNVSANTITQLYPKQSAIKKVQQPYTSFGGHQQEKAEHLYTRTSERLRHKSRAVNAWDYEHMILEAFPDIYKVKILNHACQKESDKKMILSKAGDIIILVMAKTAAGTSLYKPLVSKSKLTAVYEFIQQMAPPFATLTVINPLFEEIMIDGIVTFSEHVKDESFYEKKLQQDLRRFLSPWAFENGREPEFGGTIYRAAILDFIEELPYIDFVEKLDIFHQQSISGDMATATSPASVLISAWQHTIVGKLKSDVVQTINTEPIAFC